MPLPTHIQKLRDRVGHDYLLLPGVCGLVFNAEGHILLNRRTDTGNWAVIGGMLEPNEQPAAAVAREILEETGVTVTVERISGVYLTRIITYPNGDVAQYIVTAFRCLAVSGEPRVNDDESHEVKFFPLDALPDLSPDHLLRIEHALSDGDAHFHIA